MINDTLSQKFHPYSISTGLGKVDFLIFCVLTTYVCNKKIFLYRNIMVETEKKLTVFRGDFVASSK